MQNVQLLIHGQSVDASNQATFERISPIDGTVATKAAAATLEDVDRAIDSAQQAFKVWSKLSPTERRLRLLKAADLMDQKRAIHSNWNARNRFNCNMVWV